MNKEFFLNKILPVIVTALLSALISSLQAVLTTYSNLHIPAGNPAEAFLFGAGFKALYLINKA